ncbi:unnamed protein product [Alopecurus aequalis]
MRKCSGVILILSLAALLFLLSPSPFTTHQPASRAAGPVAHLLPSLPGLSGLYPPPANSTAHLSWLLLRPILSRSDAIPGTAAGVLEAAAAWRNLTVALAAAAATRSSQETLYANCRASVVGDSRTRGVKIPCGFAEGAAVTVVGVPKHGAAGFRVEMVGGAGEVLACFNVSLGAAGMVVEQSSWTPAGGRVGWERCPPLGDIISNSSWRLSPVDGLVRCNQQVGTNVIQGSDNTTQNVTANQPEDDKRPKGRARFSGSFSVVEGEPFTVTVWAGAEGFHMTVNGRHETSFTYRESKIMPAKYIMKTDDDAFVRIDEVISSLKKSDPHGLLYGLISFQSSPHRDKDSKWFISPKEWPIETYPPWAHGPGYIISRDIAKFVVRGHQERTLQLFKLEDVAMGIWIQQYKDSGQTVNYASDERFYSEGCDTDYVLAHYQSPRLMMCLWEKLQKESQPVCCE